MSPLVLKDGRVIYMTSVQKQKLSSLILYSVDLDRKVKLDSYEFKLTDIETDNKKIQQAFQQTMVYVPPVPVQKNIYKNRELS